MSEFKKRLGAEFVSLIRHPAMRDIHLASTEREAARLLACIIERLSVQAQHQNRFMFSFDADIEFHDRLCVWGADTEDLEDDAPLEDDETEIDDLVAF